MKVRKVIVAPFLAVALIGSTAACGERLRDCTVYEDEVLDLDDEGECYAPNDDKHGTTKGGTKSGGKSGTKKSSSGTTKKSGSSVKAPVAPVRKK